MSTNGELLRENQDLKAEIERLKGLLSESKISPSSNVPVPTLKRIDQLKHEDPASQSGSESEGESTETSSGLRIQPLFDESGQVKEVVAVVVDDIQSKKRKKKKAKKKKTNPLVPTITTPNTTPASSSSIPSTPSIPALNLLHPTALTPIASPLTPSRNRRKYLKKKEKKANKQRPVVVANLDTDALIGSVVPDFLEDYPTLENKAKELKLKVLKEAKRYNNDVELIGDSHTLEQLLEAEMEKKKYSAFYLVNLGALVEKWLQWTSLLPRVEPFYAMKSNPDINIVRTLHFLGTGFDCASTSELEEALNIGVPPSKIIFANPCKGPEHILYARSKGVSLMTFDSKAELEKVVKLHPEAKLVLRILPDDRHSLMPFGTKFGASFKESVKLIAHCRYLGANLMGVSFHVGSGCFSVSAWIDAVKLARKVFDEAEKQGFDMTLLDIGGGWPGTDDGPITMEDAKDALGPVLDDLFPRDRVKVIAEPGRFFADRGFRQRF